MWPLSGDGWFETFHPVCSITSGRILSQNSDSSHFFLRIHVVKATNEAFNIVISIHLYNLGICEKVQGNSNKQPSALHGMMLKNMFQ